MLILHGASYHNIGPFANKKLAVWFHAGKYLIKAPIGSGKSFLFFDGPLYGLYKYAKRPMLNVLSKQGSITLWCSIEDQHYLIVRKLKKGKGKDRCQSQLFLLDKPLEITTKKVLLPDVDLLDLAQKQQAIVEEVVTKNESDLQATLQSVLPPREVFLSTAFLLQDSVNLFELTPTERIAVFKNVFGLLGVDEAKELLAEKRKQIQTTRKVKSDDTRFRQGIHSDLQNIADCYDVIHTHPVLAGLTDVLSAAIQERRTFDFRVGLEHFVLQDHIPRDVLDVCDAALQKQLQSRDKERHTLQTQQDRYMQEKKKLSDLQIQQKNVLQKLTQLQQTLASIKLVDVKTLQDEQKKYKQSMQSCMDGLPLDIAHRYRNQSDFLQKHIVDDLSNIHQWKHLIDSLISTGKHLNQQKQQFEQHIITAKTRHKELADQLADTVLEQGTLWYQDLQREKENFLSMQGAKLSQLETKRDALQQQINTFTQRMKAMQDMINKQETGLQSASSFSCEKIKGDCPYIHMINKAGIKQIQEQIALVQKEQKNLEDSFSLEKSTEMIADYTKSIQTIQKDKEAIQKDPKKYLTAFFVRHADQVKLVQSRLDEHTQKVSAASWDKEVEKYAQDISTIKGFLQAIDRQKVLNLYTAYCEHEKELLEVEKQLARVQEQEEKRKQIQIDIAGVQKEYDVSGGLVQEQQVLCTEMTNKVSLLKETLAKEIYQGLDRVEDSFALLVKTYEKIQELVQEYKMTQHDVLVLQEQEKRLWNLHTIFSKELVYVVLESALPVLNDILNAYLAQVSNYTIDLAIEDDNGKVSMSAQIEDERGKRDIASLSGGQKTLLKLVWMLSVTSFMGARMLFLDETINNLDGDTVSRVAQMLEDFVRQHEISFYTVTHSQQIQEMAIWDGIVRDFG